MKRRWAWIAALLVVVSLWAVESLWRQSQCREYDDDKQAYQACMADKTDFGD